MDHIKEKLSSPKHDAPPLVNIKDLLHNTPGTINRSTLTSDLRWTLQPFRFSMFPFLVYTLVATTVIVLGDPIIMGLLRDRETTTTSLKKVYSNWFKGADPAATFFFMIFRETCIQFLYRIGPIYFLFWLVFVQYMRMGPFASLFFTITLLTVFMDTSFKETHNRIFTVYEYENIVIHSASVSVLILIFYLSNTFYTIFLATILASVIKGSILYSII